MTSPDPRITSKHSMVSASHTRSVLSPEPLTIRVPSVSLQWQGSVESTGYHDQLRRRIWNQNASPLALKARILSSISGP